MGDLEGGGIPSEDTPPANLIARHRTIISISHLRVILETPSCHHTTVGRKVLISDIWRLHLAVPAFPFRRGKRGAKSQAQVRNFLQVSVNPVEENGGKREKALLYYDLSQVRFPSSSTASECNCLVSSICSLDIVEAK